MDNDKRACGNAECGWQGQTDRMVGNIGPLCPDCGETTELAENLTITLQLGGRALKQVLPGSTLEAAREPAKLAGFVAAGMYPVLLGKADRLQSPIGMVLHCPACGLQHIDAPTETWNNPPHRSHLCGGCGHIWRPADVPTTGVFAVQTEGKDDSPLADDLLKRSADRYTKLRKTHWSDSPLCVVVNPKEAVKLGHACPSGVQLDQLVDKL